MRDYSRTITCVGLSPSALIATTNIQYKSLTYTGHHVNKFEAATANAAV